MTDAETEAKLNQLIDRTWLQLARELPYQGDREKYKWMRDGVGHAVHEAYRMGRADEREDRLRRERAVPSICDRVSEE
jgi:hypothetical protein